MVGITGVTLNNQAKLSTATPSLVAVEGVVTNVPDGHILQGDGAAPNFDAIIDVVHNLNMVDLGIATQSAQGKTVEFVGQTKHSTAVTEGQVGDVSGVVVVIATAIVVERGVSGFFDQALHVGFIGGTWREGVAREATRVGHTIKADVSIATDGQISPFVAGCSPIAIVLARGHHNWGVGVTIDKQLPTVGDAERPRTIRSGRRNNSCSSFDREGCTGPNVDLLGQVVRVVSGPCF